MQILKLKLKNVKSYGEDAPEIVFAPGTNFLSGLNGTGKSTIAEAIGYALYDLMPYDRKEDLIRRGAKTGVITVWIEDGGEIFRIERKFGSTDSWVVYDQDDVDLHSKREDVIRFLCERLKVSDPGQLPNLFENVVGVPQGKFTHLFQEAKHRRKATFDAIINVEVYRKSAEARRDVKNKMVELEIERVEGELKAARQYLDEHAEDPKTLAETRQRLLHLGERIRTLQEQRDALAKRRQELGQAKRRIEEIERTREGIRKSIEERGKAQRQAEEEVRRSRAAADACERTLAAHRAFLQATSDLDALDRSRRQRDKIQKNVSELAARIASDSASLESENKNLSSDRAAEAEVVAEVQRRAAAWKESNAKAEALAAEAEKARAEGEARRKEIEALDEQERDQAQRLAKAQAEARRIRECRERISRLENTLQAYDEIRALANTRNEARAKEKTAANRIATLEEELRQHEGNKKWLASLVCPFLQESCDRVKPEVLEAKIAPIREKLQAAREDHETARRAVEAAEEARLKLAELNEAKKSVADLRRQRSRAWKQARELLSRRPGSWGSYPSFPVDDEGDLDLTPFEEYQAALKAEVQQRRADLQKRLDDVRAAEKVAALARSRADAARESREEAEARLARIRKSIHDREAQIRALAERLADARKSESALLNELASFADLEEKLRDAQNRRNSSKAGHDEYVRNERAAGELSRRERQLDEIRRQLAEAQAHLVQCEADRKEAAKLFDAEEAERVEADFDRAGRELSAAQTSHENLAAESRRLEIVVQTMAEKSAKIKQLEREKRELRYFRDVLEVIWKILREVGPRISSRLLATISARANRIFGVLHGQGCRLSWGPDYEVRLRSGASEYAFKNLSGGEQMCAALAIQMAMARDFAGSSFCIFDEPTIHLDEMHRRRLASVIRDAQVDAGFRQVFVVSHDDTFGPYVDHEVKLQKDPARGTEVVV